LSNKDLVVYSAIFGGKDTYKEPPPGDYEVVLFTDAKIKASSHVRVVQVPLLGDPRRMSRKYKMLPHVHFPNAQYSLWMDGSIEAVKIDPRAELMKYLEKGDLAAFKHPLRKCIYEEAAAIIEYKLEDPGKIRAQVDRYRLEGYPSDAGLCECGVLFRRHNQEIRKFNEFWNEEYSRASNRDQLSFRYSAWKTGVRFAPIETSILRGSGPGGFYVRPHVITEPPVESKEPLPVEIKPPAPAPTPVTASKAKTLIEAVTESLEPDVWNNRWSQVKRFGAGMAVEYEVGVLLGALVRCIKPAIAIETGTHRGFATAMMAQALKDNKAGYLHTIDIVDYGVTKELAQYGLESWVKFHNGRSVDMLGILSKTVKKVDFLFLDADHKKDSVLSEIKAAMPMIQSGTYIALHDTIIDHEENEAVQEIRKQHFQWERIRIVTARGFDLLRVP